MRKYLQIKADNKQSGFIALMATIILTSALMLLMFSSNTSSFFARFDALGSENKRISLGLSEACSNAAILKIAQNFNYSPASGGDIVKVGTNDCIIKSVDYKQIGSVPITIQKSAVIKTLTHYPEENGSWTTNQIAIKVQNPTYSATVPPPTCTLNSSSPVLVGKPLQIGWAFSNNPTSFEIKEGQGGTKLPTVSIASVSPAPITAPTSPGDVTYTGTVSNIVGSTQCSTTVTVLPLPPAPSCADTVLMLDRTGTMFGNNSNYNNHPEWAGDQEKAANELATLYSKTPSPHPQLSIGHFSDKAYTSANQNKTSAEIVTGGQLDSSDTYYSTLSNVIHSAIFPSITFPPIYAFTNTGDAISKADIELNSSRHILGKKKLLIMISDGQVNVPTSDPQGWATTKANAAKSATGAGKASDNIETKIYTIHFGDTTNQGFLATLATGDHMDDFYTPAQHISPSTWGNVDGGLVDDDTYVTSSVNNQTQGFSSYGFPGLDAGAYITGIQTKVKGIVKSKVLSVALNPNNTGNYNSWTTTGGTNKVSLVTDTSDNTYVKTSSSGAAQTFRINTSSIPSGSTINSVQLTLKASRTSTTGPSFSFRIEKGSGLNIDTPGGTLGTSFANFSTSTMTKNPFTNAQWTLNELGSLGFGAVKNNVSGTVQVSRVLVTVEYTPPLSNCSVGVELSWNNGSSWTTSGKTVTLTNSPQTTTLGTSTDTWGHNPWSSGNVASFATRIKNNSCSNGIEANIDSISADIYYTENFYIAPSSDKMSEIFVDIGKKECKATAPACFNTTDDDLDGKIDQDDPGCHTDKNPLNSASYDPDDNDEWTASTLTNPPPPDPISPVSVDSWDECSSTVCP